MKIVLSSLLLFVMLVAGSDRSVTDLNGIWLGTASDGSLLSFEFKSDGYLGMTVDEQVMDPYGFDYGPQKMVSVYKTDFTKTPIQIDWMFVKKDSDEIMVHREGIINFKDDNTIEIDMDDKGDRPVDFTSDSVVTFKRVK